jgi:hypothetical protein
MQITVTIPDEFAAQVRARGLTPEGYVERLIAEQAGAARNGSETRLVDLELFLAEISAHSEESPVLADAALTRESIYQDHD